jgi:hypothetical protein
MFFFFFSAFLGTTSQLQGSCSRKLELFGPSLRSLGVFSEGFRRALIERPRLFLIFVLLLERRIPIKRLPLLSLSPPVGLG